VTFFRLHHAKVLDALAEMPSDSFDGVLCDPPYGLSDDTPQGFADRALRALRKIGLPDLDKLEAGLAQRIDLAAIALDGSGLCRRKLRMVVEAPVGVPESAVDLQDDPLPDKEIDAGEEPAREGAADRHLPAIDDSGGIEFLGDYVLDLRDAADFTAGDILGGGLCQLFPGGVGVPIVTAILPGLHCPLSSFLLGLPTLGRDEVRRGADARKDAERARQIVATPGAKTRSMLRFLAGAGGSLELLTANPATEGNGSGETRSAKLVRARPGAGGLPPEAEAHRVGLVGTGADGARPRHHFTLWLRKGSLGHLAKILPPGGFMGKDWDHGVPGVETWREVLRVLKPGANLLAFGGPRTFHRLAVAIEDAGFELYDSIAWIHGQGFSKGLDISKAIDKAAGTERPRVAGGAANGPASYGGYKSGEAISGEAKRWEGYKTALKPAFEPVIVARKPCVGTFAENALAYGVAGLHIEAGRIDWSSPEERAAVNQRSGPNARFSGKVQTSVALGSRMPHAVENNTASGGRYPANVILSHSPDCVLPDDEVFHVQRGGTVMGERGIRVEQLEARCAPGCPVAEMDRQSGELQSGTAVGGLHRRSNKTANTYGTFRGREVEGDVCYGDAGGASRFFLTLDGGRRELLFERAECILRAWNPDLASIAALPSARRSQAAASALSDAVTLASRGDVRSSDWTGLSTIATESELRSLCASAIAATLNFDDGRLLALLPAGLTPYRCRAKLAAPSEPTGITTTIQSPPTSAGSAVSAIFESMRPSTAPGEAGSGEFRFRYVAKVAAIERAGSKHPTLKPIDLCRYLAALILPPARPGDVRRLLVPFSGAGSEMIGAGRAGWEDVTGIEMEAASIEDAERRIRGDAPLFNRTEILTSPNPRPSTAP